MPHYRVVWPIDIEADSHREAAEQAHKIQKRRGSSATFFEVTSYEGVTLQIDVADEPEPEEEIIYLGELL